MSNHKHRYLVAASAAAAAAIPQLAQAQDTNQPSAVSSEIVVTAQRRQETLKEVPVAITAVPPERLEQLAIRSVDQLQQVTPGLVFNTGYTYSQTFIRGVGANFPNPGLEPAVATYVDGAYTERGFGSLYEMVDVQTIQVLKGPQGTLWGRNATGGAILINSQEPTDNFQGSVVGELGSLDHQLLDGVLNVPISETLSARFAGRYRHDGGYVRNLFSGNKLGGNSAYVGRGRLKWEPSDNFKAILTFQYNETKGSTPPAAQRLGLTTTRTDFTGPFAPYNGVPLVTCFGCDPAFAGNRSPVSKFYQSDQNEPEVLGVSGTGGKSYFYNLQLSGTLGPIELQSTTAFRNQDDFSVADLDFTRAALFHYGQFSGSEAFTQELIGTFDIFDRLKGIVGGSYLHDKSYFSFVFDGIPFQAAQAASASGEITNGTSSVTTESYSLFGELTLEPIDGLKFTAGGRYTHDKRSLHTSMNDTATIAFGVPDDDFGRKDSFGSSFTPRFVVSYDAGPVNLYASYNEGYKAGGYSTPALILPFGDLIVRPEKIKSYEIGAKFVSGDGRLRANVSAFKYDYTDVQVTVIRLDLGGAVVVNGAGAKGKGIDFDMQWQPTDWLTLFGGGQFLDTKFKSFPNGAGAGPTGDPLGPTASFGDISEDLAGFPLARSPDFSGNIGFTLAGPIGDWKADLTGFLRYTDKYDFVPGAGGPLRTDTQPSFTTVNLSGNVGPESGAFSIGFYVNNLTNEKYQTFRQSAANFGAFDYVAPPRSYGMRVKFAFGG